MLMVMDWVQVNELKIEIQLQRKNIANVILDSVQNYKNQMTIAESEKLMMIAHELLPGNKRENQIYILEIFDWINPLTTHNDSAILIGCFFVILFCNMNKDSATFIFTNWI